MKYKDEEFRPLDPDEYRHEVEQVAYSYWESRDHQDGHDLEDWLMAEQEVLRRHRMQAPGHTRHANAA